MAKKVHPKGKVFLVGAGPGDPSLLTLRGRDCLMSADVIIYDWLVSEELLNLNPYAKKIYAGKKTQSSKGLMSRGNALSVMKPVRYVKQDEINRTLVRYANQGKKIVRLKGGDPFVFGRGGEEASYLSQKKVTFEVVPGVSSGWAVPAYAGIPITDRRHASSVTFVTGHEHASALDKSNVDWKLMAKQSGSLVCFMSVKNLKTITQTLREEGMPVTTLVTVIERGTFSDQQVIEGNLKTIVKKVIDAKIQSPAIAVIGRVNGLRKKLRWFESKPLFGKNVLITRARTQASELKKKVLETGAQVLEFPAISIAAPKQWKPVDQSFKEMKKYDWVVFTSVNGVESVFGRLCAIKKDSRVFSTCKVAAIGEATAAALMGCGIQADLVPSTFTSCSLVQAFKKKKIKGQSILLLRTDIAPPYLAEELKKLGAKVQEVTAYRTLANREGKTALHRWLKEMTVDYALFTSSSTVDNFFKAIPASLKKEVQKIRFISIGPVTSATLKKHGYTPFCEAKKHTLSGLVHALQRS